MTGPLSRRGLLGAAAVAGLAGCAQSDFGQGPPSGSSSPTGSSSPSGGASSSATTASPSESPSSSPTSTAPVNRQRSLTTVMSGDLLWHNTLWFTAANDHRRTGKGDEFDFDPMFAAVKPIISGADLAIAHNEVPFAKPGGPYLGYPTFAAPPQIAAWMATMGWDMATTASNHSLDQGFTGLTRTTELLQDAGLAVVGTYATEAAANTPVIVEKAGVKVAVVSGTYGTNGIPLPQDKPWCVDMWQVERMLADARAARAAGAEIVLAHLHGGEEYQVAPSQEQVSRATTLAGAPEIDLVFGEHVHVVQPITMINGTWVVYGMGNMVAQHLASVPRGYEGITVRFTWAERDEPLPGKLGRFEVSKAEYIPSLVTSHLSDGAARLYAVNEALRVGTGPTARLQTALERTRQAVLSLQPPAGLVEA
ncbi:CapA family protein [Aestuariimicrobium sp. Y1814]|uniref:CapA family protein n=1 Tax=Aestuariimicrobium sp. Y1814 TaxID=3418742 RepID=UPI003DA7A034